ncbi:DUF2505 domain-containing protein [Mycolicibacterium komossense]|uniref:DUF2505 domain-containing protein n=1 Tax=Mycolicibacterium komossense TaxID=1779 RepID=A0ABT3CLP8_9MYCO|nr:DUF2505 domain-containing protein [Mycolicibacterium komossense]MCV7230268.1 DUF2505 domain-containing protein [Mycolicibacterium komossense]
MPRSFDISVDYDGSVEHVHRAFEDKQYWLARLADSGVDDASLDSLELDPDGGVTVATTQVLRSDRLPAVVVQFHKGDLRIERRESWRPVRDGQASATVAGAITAAPVSLTGAATLKTSAGGAGARLDFHVTVEVRIPLVGGKIESLIGKQLVDLVVAEQRFTTKWIAENS